MYMRIRNLKFTHCVGFLYLSIYMVVQKSTAEGNTKSFHAFSIAFQDKAKVTTEKQIWKERNDILLIVFISAN